MNMFSRGIRNAFRNGIRTASITVILGLSIGLCLTMLVAHKAVENKISSVKSSIGNTINISAAGIMGFQGGGNPLSQTTVDKVKTLSHVTNVSETISDELRNSDSTSRSGTTTSANTSLVSAIEAGSLGRRFGGQNTDSSSSNQSETPQLPIGGGFTPGISGYGTSDTTTVNGSTVKLTSGSQIDGNSDKAVALVGTSVASKNNLKVGSVFMAYGTSVTVTGIFDTGTTFSNNAVIFSLPTLQRLSGQTGDLTSAVVTVDSISNIDSTTAVVKKTLGDTADVTSSKTSAQTAIQPLDSVKTISLFSLIGAVIAGAVIILLTLIMVVRERKREIGVIKAIGGSNLRIMSEFMIESLTLALLGALIGLLIGVVGGQPVTKMLINNSTSQVTPTSGFPGRPRFDGTGTTPNSARLNSSFGRGFRNNGAVRNLNTIKAQVGWDILLDGFGAAILISVIGSALAAGLIAKVRPSEVMRSL